MALEIEEKFQVKAPVERVWQFLLDPKQVVVCLPGAELTEVIDARHFTGNMKVKVGPVTVVYKGKLEITDIDEAAHQVKMVGEGTEKSGGGSAKMTMRSEVRAVDGGAEVVVASQVDLVGRIVQFGRGMMLAVAQQLFKQFTERARTVLEVAAPVVEAPATAPASAGHPTAAPTVASPEKPTTPEIAATETKAAPAPAAPLAPAEPVRLLPLLFKALWAWLRRLFGGKAAG